MSYTLSEGRIYTHTRCGTQTGITEEHFEGLCNPLQTCIGTFCASCQKAYPLKEFNWSDTDERIDKYRSRLVRHAPAFLKHWRYWLSWLTGAAVGALVGYFVIESPKLPPIQMAATCALVGVFGVPLLVTPVLVSSLCKTKFYEYE